MSTTYKVYLAGPITGLGYDEATDWRNALKGTVRRMSGDRIECFSPLRSKPHLAGIKKIADCYGDNVLSTERGIMTRDRYDVMSSDLVMVNFLGATRVSVGTVMEVAWADMLRKPLVVAMEPADNLHDHSMIRQAIGFRVTNLDDAAQMICRVLLP